LSAERIDGILSGIYFGVDDNAAVDILLDEWENRDVQKNRQSRIASFFGFSTFDVEFMKPPRPESVPQSDRPW